MCLYGYRYCFGHSFNGKTHGARAAGQYLYCPNHILGDINIALAWSALQRRAEVLKFYLLTHGAMKLSSYSYVKMTLCHFYIAGIIKMVQGHFYVHVIIRRKFHGTKISISMVQ